MRTTLKPAPLAVVLVAHPNLKDRASVLDGLVRRLQRDPDVPFSPAPGVPVVSGSIARDGTLQSAFPNAERRAVLVALDDHAITDFDLLDGIDRLTESAASSALRVFLVPLTPNAFRPTRTFVQTNFLRFDDDRGPLRWSRVGSALTHELCRWMQGRQRFAADTATSSDSECAITVFLSHAKSDGAGIAREFVAHLHERSRLDSFFDAHDIAPGFPFAGEIEIRIGQSILLVIRTDAYGAREWCQREVLSAKRAGVPVVMVDALEGSERRSFPYLGNVPTIRFQGNDPNRHERVLDLLLDETLRQLHFRIRVERHLQDVRGSKPVILGSAPELVRFALHREAERRDGSAPRRRKRHVVYPDPPLSGPESDVLSHDAETIRAESLTQFVSRRAALRPGQLVALSTSDADDLASYGLSSLHHRDLVVELARHLFASGSRIAYGGDFRKSGFAELLEEVQRAHTRFAGEPVPKIVSYLSDPLTAGERAQHVDTIQFVGAAAEEVSTAAQSPRDRALKLRAMRFKIAGDAIALVAVGGRSGGFASWRPGVAEEIASALSLGKPVFLIGGFGGVAGSYAKAAFMRGEITFVQSPKGIGDEPTSDIALPSEMEVLQRLRGRGNRNGLSQAENAQLAVSADTDEIVALILRGLAAIAARER